MTDIEVPSEVVQRLHKLRVFKGLKIQQMAETCGLPKSSLESYMKTTGARRPGLDALVAMADGMSVSVDWLVGRAKDNPPLTLSEKDYAIGCFSVVSGHLHFLRSEQLKSGLNIFTDEKVAGVDEAEVAAKSMLIFMETMQRFNNTADAAGPTRDEVFDGLNKLLSQRQPATK